MQIRTVRNILLILALSSALCGCGTLFGGEKPYEETSGRSGWHPFLRPRKETPAEQLEYAAYLQDVGRTWRAGRHYRALFLAWPESREAAIAQYEYARLLDVDGEYRKAFDEYQRLFDEYAGMFPYDEVLERQFEIAEYMMNRKKGKFLIFPGFSAPERAVPLFEQVIENGPQWRRAPEAQYLVGEAYEQSLQYEEAIAAYMITQQRYPDSPYAETASFRTAYCFYLLAEESPFDEQLLESAWAAMTLFLATHPQSEHADLAREYRETLYRQRARLAYNTAVYYDRIEKRPKSALISYETLVREFPRSDWTELAKLRIEALSKIVENDDE